MAETAQEFSDFETIFDLLESIGFADARKPENSSSENLASGITWSIATINGTQIRGNKIDDWERIEEDLRLIGCPFSLQASHVPRLDGEAVFSVVQWLASRIRGMSDHSKSQQTKDTVLNEMKCLQEEIFKADAHDVVQNLMTCSKTLKDLEKQESEFLSTCNAKRQELKSEILELEEKLVRGYDCSSFIDSIDNSISQSQEKINSVKKALASRLRATLALKRLLDDVPTQSELIQYERRFSELYVSIQGKLRQTRRYYATYNALLEIKDLMAKETSLLNSISSQFQDAITSSMSQTKLIDSMEGILKGTRQKLDKVQLSHQEEQQVCHALKERYAAVTAEQRRSYILLKAFQEECAKNERLRIQNSM